MPFKLENEFCRLEVIPEAAEITSFFDKTNNVEIMYQGDEGWSGRNPSLSLSSVVHIQSIMKFTENNIR